jgi:hypothetical protein
MAWEARKETTRPMVPAGSCVVKSAEAKCGDQPLTFALSRAFMRLLRRAA